MYLCRIMRFRSDGRFSVLPPAGSVPFMKPPLSSLLFMLVWGAAPRGAAAHLFFAVLPGRHAGLF